MQDTTVEEFAFTLPWISLFLNDLFLRGKSMDIRDGVFEWRSKSKKGKILGNVEEDWQKVANAILNQISLESLNVDYEKKKKSLLK